MLLLITLYNILVTLTISMLSLTNKVPWHHRKTAATLIREGIRLRGLGAPTARSGVPLPLVPRVKSWTKRYSVWETHMTQLKRAHRGIRAARLAQQGLWVAEETRDALWRWVSPPKHRRFGFANEHSVVGLAPLNTVRAVAHLIYIPLPPPNRYTTDSMPPRRQRTEQPNSPTPERVDQLFEVAETQPVVRIPVRSTSESGPSHSQPITDPMADVQDTASLPEDIDIEHLKGRNEDIRPRGGVMSEWLWHSTLRVRASST